MMTPASSGAAPARTPEPASGIIAVRETLVDARSGWRHDPTIVLDRPRLFETAVTRLQAFKAAGGVALLDWSGSGGFRDPDLLAAIGEASGVQVLTTAGFGTPDCLPSYYLVEPRPDVASMAAQLAQAVQQGQLVEPGMRRTTHKASALLASADGAALDEAAGRVLRATVSAALHAGAPLFLNSVASFAAAEPIIEQAGLPPARVVIGHCDTTALHQDRVIDYAKRGYRVAVDHVGWGPIPGEEAMSDEQRAQLVLRLAEQGLCGNVLLSCNTSMVRLGGQPSSPHASTHLLESFVPLLRKTGVQQADVDQILIANPAQLLRRSDS